MPGRELSREELFALVWEKPTLEIAKELGISVTNVDCYAGDDYVAFIIRGTRFRKDGTLGKMQESLSLHLPP